ncbi:hypothetical protein [Arthrobacter sp. CJ23]|uniref:hypothetical protein n=1 Tax=Arthrobacter sp. CJ23 TaxID=2972479 RepID=UPI00215D04D7|nr:hypothetical protein [Arthrobacter sp. CJ23]UVJ39476.1 hypothetical protein NVV90_20145 [Arthrobacter sp. CJ23]
MGHGGVSRRRRAVAAGAVGLVLVAGYAVAGAFQILVWNPLAAVPGATLEEIHAEMARANETLAAPLVLTWAVVGVVLAASVVLAALAGSTTRVKTVVVLELLILVLGAPSHWFAAFPAGMGIADAFLIGGGDYAPWGGLLYAVSLAALFALVVIALAGRRRREDAILK